MSSDYGLAAAATDHVFTSLAEQLKMPFLHIALASEQSRQAGAQSEDLQHTIQITTEAALRLLDSYLLSLQAAACPLPLEPVALSSLMHDVAHKLSAYARAHSCQLRLQLAGKYGPVMARHDIVESALLSLGYSFIEAQTAQGAQADIHFTVRRNAYGITAGLYTFNDTLSNELYARAKKLQGRARQPLGGFTAGSGAGVFIADRLLTAIESPLRVAYYNGMRGLAATLQPSRQLSLV